MKQYILILELNCYETMVEEYDTIEEANKNYEEHQKTMFEGEIITLARIIKQITNKTQTK